MAAKSSTVFTLASVTILGGLVAYAVYFDYRRRNDIDFRKKLRKEKKRVNKQASQAQQTQTIDSDELRAALAKVREELIPPTSEEREQYFMAQVGLGEQLCAQGPAFQLPAALSFYRALRVYPSPVELIMIYQKTVPEPVFKVVMELTNLDVSTPPSAEQTAGSEHSEHHDAPEDDDTSPTRTGPPSEASSQEWDRLTDSASGLTVAP